MNIKENPFKNLLCALQDLENSIRNHSEERLDKIKELGNELIEHECMAESILADVKSVTDRWDLLQQKVRDHFMWILLFVRGNFMLFKYKCTTCKLCACSPFIIASLIFSS